MVVSKRSKVSTILDSSRDVFAEKRPLIVRVRKGYTAG